MPEGCHRTLTLRAAVAPPIVRSVATATNNQTTAGQNNTNAGIQRASPVSLYLHHAQSQQLSDIERGLELC